MKEETARWLEQFTPLLESAFAGRIRFLGLQGSRRREEEGPDSDLDLVLVLDRLEFSDLACYRDLLAEMPSVPRPCGFLCGLEELQSWPKFDLFGLYCDTQPLFGDLSRLVPFPTEADVRESVAVGAANLLHEICHRQIYGVPGRDALAASLKTAKFLAAARHFLRTGSYEGGLEALLAQSVGIDREVLRCCRDGAPSLEEGAALLLRYCQICLRDSQPSAAPRTYSVGEQP